MSASVLLESGIPNYGAADVDKGGKHRQQHVGNSWFLTAGIIIANTGGAASLDMPSAYAEFGGWLPGTIFMILQILMNMHLSILVWRLYMCFPEQSTYVGIIGQTFSKQSLTQQRFMMYFAAICQYGYCFSCVAFNLLLLGDGLGYMLPSWHVCLPILMLIWFLVCVPFQVTMRQVGSWKSLVVANLVFATLLVAIPLISFASAGIKSMSLPSGHFYMASTPSIGNVFSATSTIAFMLTTQYLVVEFAQEMNDPKEFPQSYRFAVVYQIVVYGCCGFGGYYYLGSAGTGMLLNYLPFGSALTWSAIGMQINVLLVLLISGVVFCKALHSWIDPEFSESGSIRDWTWWSVIVVVVLFVAWFVGNLVPFFTDLVNLLGTTIAPLSCYVIPVVAYGRAYIDFQESDKKLGRISRPEWILIAVEFFVALALISYGTYVQVSKIVSGWASYGYPFQCHCQLLWDTCDCSSMRPGMEMCYANSTFLHSGSF